MERDSREKLIEAATPLFAYKGFAAVSIRELANEAGTNSALVSYHFGGKEGLYAAVLEEQFSQLGSLIEMAKKNPLQPLEKISLYPQIVTAIHRKMPFLVRFIHSELTNPTNCFESIIKKNIARVYQFLHDTIAEGIKMGQFREDIHPGYAATALAGMINFYLIVRPIADGFLPQDSNRDEKYIAQAIDIYLYGMRRG